MATANPIWRWILPSVLLVVAFSNLFAWRIQPASTLVSQMWASSSATLSSPNPSPTVAWRLLLLLDTRAIPPGPEWILHEGRQPGEGYELHWLPRHLSLQIFRTGGETMLLGSVTLKQAPGEVQFARRGLRLSVRADRNEVLSCIDLTPPPAPQVWGFQAEASVGNVLVSLFDDTRYLDPSESILASADLPSLRDACADPTSEDHALARMRYSAALDPGKSGAALSEALAEADTAIRAMGAHHADYPSLQAWSAWARLRAALADPERGSLDHARDAFAALRAQLSGNRNRAPELPGLLLQTLPALTLKACARLTGPATPGELFEQRRLWFTLLSQAGHCATDALPEAVTDNVLWQLRLLVHGTDCLNNQSPQPTPAEGPDWATSRWRAFAGRDPRVTEFTPLPSGWNERNPVHPALEKLIAFANFEPLAAVSMHVRILDGLDHQSAAEISEALQGAPARETALAQALLALRGKGDLVKARADLVTERGQLPPLADQDPFAYALVALLDHRQIAAPIGDAPPRTGAGVTVKDPTLLASRPISQALKPYERLLNGKATATSEIWGIDAAVLPPAQALATALAMQEVAGLSPDWTLLDQIHCFTLPLDLMIPPRPAEQIQKDAPAPAAPPNEHNIP